MDPVLEEVVAADEELRARLSAVCAAAEARAEAARVGRERRQEQQLEDAEQKLQGELRAIAETAERDIAQRRRRRAEWLVARETSAAARLPKAAETWAGIVWGT